MRGKGALFTCSMYRMSVRLYASRGNGALFTCSMYRLSVCLYAWRGNGPLFTCSLYRMSVRLYVWRGNGTLFTCSLYRRSVCLYDWRGNGAINTCSMYRRSAPARKQLPRALCTVGLPRRGNGHVLYVRRSVVKNEAQACWLLTESLSSSVGYLPKLCSASLLAAYASTRSERQIVRSSQRGRL